MMAGIPFDGPVSGVRVGLQTPPASSHLPFTGEEVLVVNPTIPQFDANGLNLLVSGKA